MKSKLPTGDALRHRARELGVVATRDDPNEPTGDYAMFRAVVSESELQQRVIAAENARSARLAWVCAAISAAASLASAAASFLAVYVAR